MHPERPTRITSVAQIFEYFLSCYYAQDPTKLYRIWFKPKTKSFILASDLWRLRELVRSWTDREAYELPSSWPMVRPNTPEYMRPVWAATFPHASLTQPGMLAYTSSPEKGRADVQTLIKPGRYLKKYFPDLSDETITGLVNDFQMMHGEVEVKFARTAKDIVQVYRVGPHSCEAGSSLVRVYATDDVGVAYLGNLNTKVSARCVCNMKNKRYGRHYGDDKIAKALEQAGFEASPDALDGCRLQAIENDDGNYVMPYVDGGATRGSYKNGFIVLGFKGTWECQQQDSAVGDDIGEDDVHFTCDYCNDREHNDERNYSEYHEIDLCDHCANEHFLFAYFADRHSDQTWVCSNECITIDDDTAYLNDSAVLKHHSIVRCEDGDYRHVDDCVCTEEGDWFEIDADGYVYDVDGDENYHTNCDDYIEIDDKFYTVAGGLIVQPDDNPGEWHLKVDCYEETGVWYSSYDATPTRQLELEAA